MTEHPTLDYRPPEPIVRLRASDYVVATLRAMLVFFGALVVLQVGVGIALTNVGLALPALVVASVAVWVLAVLAGISSFVGSLERARELRGQSR